MIKDFDGRSPGVSVLLSLTISFSRTVLLSRAQLAPKAKFGVTCSYISTKQDTLAALRKERTYLMYRISDQSRSSKIPVIKYPLLQANKMSPYLVLPQFSKDLENVSKDPLLKS